MSAPEEFIREPIALPQIKNKLLDTIVIVTSLIVCALFILSLVSLKAVTATQASSATVEQGNALISCRAALRTDIDTANAALDLDIASLLVAATTNRVGYLAGAEVEPVSVAHLVAMQDAVIESAQAVTHATEDYIESDRDLLDGNVSAACPGTQQVTGGS